MATPPDGQTDPGAQPVTAERIHEGRVLTLRVTGRPDLAPNYGPTLVPETVEITYIWHHPEDPGNGRGPHQPYVTVRGRRRLVSGQLGLPTSAISRELFNPATFPDWVTALVAEHRPEGWNQ